MVDQTILPIPQLTDTVPPPTQSHGPHLPLEIVVKIIHQLRQERQYACLAQMAQANSTYYDLVIPKLYETITITKTNLGKFTRGHESSIPHSTDSTDQSDSPLPPRRQDKAVEHCLRIIIDVALNDVPKSAECIINRSMDDHYGNVEELVFTTRALLELTWEEYHLGSLSNYLPSTRSTDISEDAEIRQPCKAKRVVLFLPPRHMTPNPSIIGGWDHWRHNLHPPGRNLIQFVFNGVSLGYPSPSGEYYDLNAECHFAPISIPPEQPGDPLTDWVYIGLANIDIREDCLLKLYDVPKLVLRPEDRPDDREEATQLALGIIKGHLLDLYRFDDDRETQAKAIMDRIQLRDSEYEAEEYPISRPRPVIETPSPVSTIIEGEASSVEE